MFLQYLLVRFKRQYLPLFKNSNDPLCKSLEGASRYQRLFGLHQRLQGFLATGTNLKTKTQQIYQYSTLSKGNQANPSSYLLNSGTLGECNCLADEGSQLDWKSSVDWNEAPDLLGIMEPEPERLGEPAEKVNMVNIKEEHGKPVVERLVRLTHVLREHWDDGHLSNLLYYPGNGMLPKYTSKRACF